MKIEHNVLLKNHTTLKTGGFARLFSLATTRDDIVASVQCAKENSIPLCVLGGGSNILVSESGFDGIVLNIKTDGITFEDVDERSVKMKVEAGVAWDECVSVSVGRGLYGLENLSLIPGSVGAAPIQNIGAYGCEVAQLIDTVEVYNKDTMVFELLANKECQFGYRDSFFKTKEGKKYIVVGVNFILQKQGVLHKEYKDIQDYEKEHGPIESLEALRQAVIAVRMHKLPDMHIYGTAGSFFKNPIISNELCDKVRTVFPDIPTYPSGKEGFVKVSAAFLIDKGAGMKGVQVGNVGTYKNQALVLVNYGDATGEEIRSFAERVRQVVYEKSGIDLEMEVQTLGF